MKTIDGCLNQVRDRSTHSESCYDIHIHRDIIHYIIPTVESLVQPLL